MHNFSNLEEIIKQFPYLINFDTSLPIELLNKTKLRVINPTMKPLSCVRDFHFSDSDRAKEKFQIRPRKIEVIEDSTCQLDGHPELFEKVESVVINFDSFNFDVLPSRIKKIEIRNKVNLKSITLNRLEKEREKV